MARSICTRCERYPCQCRCPVCKTRLPESSTRRFRYCSRSCRDKAQRQRDKTKNTAALRLTETNEWYTPPEIIDKARRVLGGFDLDPASCAEGNEVVRADRYLTEADDGLAHDWHGRIWLNPPYGRIAGKFVERLTQQRDAGNVTAAIVLVNAHSTDARWFWPLWDGLLCFTYQRLDFSNGTGRRQGSTHGSVLAYFGQDPDRFAAEFKDVGAIVRRWP